MSYEFRFPDIGEGLTEGKILEFKIEPGAEVVAGDILAIVETDKVVAEIASPRSGVLVKFGSAVGDRIGVGETLAFIDPADGATDADGSGATAAGAARPNGGHEFQALVGTLDAAPSTLPESDEFEAHAVADNPVKAEAPAGAAAQGGGTSEDGARGMEDGRPPAGGRRPVRRPAARRAARDAGCTAPGARPGRRPDADHPKRRRRPDSAR